ncbi:unnamed protein product [Moneuplotes crassus]|uniref:Uncharacterized protein n=1 Tax=Euplotes crassus TaxID=5936 RepID=A0AAD2D2I0_EUPCR|nr:unnamed protein product [Moneuplotes crassus]
MIEWLITLHRLTRTCLTAEIVIVLHENLLDLKFLYFKSNGICQSEVFGMNGSIRNGNQISLPS